MPLHTGIGIIYSILSEGRSEQQQLELDALLGDENAQAELNRSNMALVIEAGGEVA